MERALLLIVVLLHLLSIFWVHVKFHSNYKRPLNEKRITDQTNFIVSIKDYLYTPVLIIVMLNYIFFNQHQFLIGTSVAVKIFGLIACLCGFLLKFWSYNSLGKNWSPKINIYEDQELVAFGPYKHVRHPVYVSYLITFGGISIYCGNLLLLALSIGYLLLNAVRARREEKLLKEKFGQRYIDYLVNTGMFVPKMAVNVLWALIIILNIIGGISEAEYLFAKSSVIFNFSYKIAIMALRLLG
jgi:protein-S-isoprenylcysteine O-methyltransferase Ste14